MGQHVTSFLRQKACPAFQGPGAYTPCVRATLPPSTLFADRALLHRGYSISEPNCHRYDFLVCFWNGLNFFELFISFYSLGLITNPHVLYIHMTYVYSFFSHV